MPSFPLLNARQTAQRLPWPALVEEEIVRLLRADCGTVPPRLVQAFGQSVRQWLAHQLRYRMARLIVKIRKHLHRQHPQAIVVKRVGTGEFVDGVFAAAQHHG